MIDITLRGNVFILTREGKEYSDEGCQYVEDMIRQAVNDSRPFVYSMGAVYNNVEHLRKCLVNNRNSYVVISTKQKIWILGFEEDHQKKLIDKLRDADITKSSWEIALDLFYELYPEIEKDFPKKDQ